MHKKEHKAEVKTEAGTGGDSLPAPDSPAGAASPPPPATVPSLAPEDIDKLRAEAAKAREHWDRLLRATAEFDNYKKRMSRERQEAARYASAPVLSKLIPVLDNFDMALAAAGQAQNQSLQSLQAGIEMIHQQLRGALAEAGLEEIDATGKAFDHNWHEAVAQQPTLEVPEGQVVQQLRKGYKLHDRLLRPAGVVVARKPSADNAAPAAGATAEAGTH